ncbi:MAG TPA: DinB family protein [Gemmatimonadaceae bacterium]
MKLALLTLTAAATVASAQARVDSTRMAVTAGFNEVATWVTKSADMVPADKYAYKPVNTVRSFGELAAHVADGMNWYCGQATGKKTPWSDATEKGKTDKATVVAALTKAVAACNAQYSGTGKFQPLMANVAHTSLHYGNIITYLRMMGMVPPSS